MNMQTTDQTTEGVAPESQRDSQQRLAMPREQEPSAERTTDAVRSGVGGAMTFAEHKEQTASDCEQIAEMLTKLAATVREGNLRAFEHWWLEGGTEEGDAKVQEIRERIALRYLHREERVSRSVGAEPVADNGTREAKSGAQGHSDKMSNGL